VKWSHQFRKGMNWDEHFASQKENFEKARREKGSNEIHYKNVS
jgi:hypothetical protein